MPKDEVKMPLALKLLVAVFIMATAAALSSRYAVRAGFLVAVSLATMRVLPLSYGQHGAVTAAFTVEKSRLLAIPIMLLFFTPLVLAERCRVSCW